MTVKQRLTRTQARQIREEIREADQKEKNVRLLGRTDFQFTPRIQKNIECEKTPRAIEDPGSRMHKLMEWSKDNADTDGFWSWGPRQWSTEDWNNIIYPNLQEFERLTWADIEDQRTGNENKRRAKHHDMSPDDIVKEASDRWLELGLDEYDVIFRFRLQGEARLWGYRTYAKLFLLWWDKFHKIYRPRNSKRHH